MIINYFKKLSEIVKDSSMKQGIRKISITKNIIETEKFIIELDEEYKGYLKVLPKIIDSFVNKTECIKKYIRIIIKCWKTYQISIIIYH